MKSFKIWLENLDPYEQSILSVLINKYKIDAFEANQAIIKHKEAIDGAKSIGSSPEDEAFMIHRIWQVQADRQHSRDNQRDTRQTKQLAADIASGKRPWLKQTKLQVQRIKLSYRV